MGKIIKYAILAAVLYAAYTQVPVILENVDNLGSDLDRKGSGLGQGACLQAAEDASETFGRGLRDFSEPPIDLEAWGLFLEGVKERQYEAESQCSCPRESCDRASEALAELSSLISDFDGSLQGDGMPLNPARRQETIDRLLKRARELDRMGR